MSVDGNFKRLEDEVTRLLELLDQLREQNTALQDRLADLEARNETLSRAASKLASFEEEYGLAVKSREEVKTRVERILSRLESSPVG